VAYPKPVGSYHVFGLKLQARVFTGTPGCWLVGGPLEFGLDLLSCFPYNVSDVIHINWTPKRWA
jgi:hypothetical protein